MLNVSPDYLKILQEDVENFVSINCATRVTQKGRIIVRALPITVRRKETSHHASDELQYTNDTQYVVEAIVRYDTTKTDSHYAVF